MMKENIEVGKRESTRNDIAHDKIHHKIKHYLYRYFLDTTKSTNFGGPVLWFLNK